MPWDTASEGLRWDLGLDFRGFCSLLVSERGVLGRLYSRRGSVLTTSLLTGRWRCQWRMPGHQCGDRFHSAPSGCHGTVSPQL